MEIKTQTQQGYTSLIPVGEIDANSSIFLEERLSELLANGKAHIHVNLEETEYISSAGLGVFISKLDEFAGLEGKLVLSSLRDNVKEVFDLLGLSQLVTIVKDESEVATHFQKQ